MKKIMLILLTALVSLLPESAVANSGKSLVIIDSGIATDSEFAKTMLIEEACFIEFGKCPNGQSSMVGFGSARIDPSNIKDRSLHHGTQMSSVALQIDPAIKLVMVRVVGISSSGYANTYRSGILTKALEWVDANSERLNVGAVSISLGRSYAQNSCPIELPLQTQVKKLLEKNIPVVAASGNGSSSKKIDYPACIPEVVAVGATDTRYSQRGVTGWIYPVMRISNSSPDLDYYTLGKYITTNMFGEKSLQVGTSVSTVAFATNLVKIQNSGTDRKELFIVINTTLENAYRSMQDISKKHYSVSR
jgi:hypothetical protein